MCRNYLHLLTLIVIISSCGGGGGGSSEPPVVAPTVSISLSSSSIVLGESATINWSSSNATSCTATGSWSGSKATTGTETLTPSGVGFFNYGISCSGSGGSRSSSVGLEVYRQTDGVSVDGYIRGAEIYIDKNNNFIFDIGDENSTTSDNDGKFTIKYDDGNLISLGGIDLDTGNPLDNFLINQNLSGYSEFKVITPITSVASFLNDSTSINNVLGIDSSIDVFSFDPVANKGDNGVNDYLYEKGNQLTILAFSLQNIINNINLTTETSQDYFKSIAEEIDLEYEATSKKVDIETSSFVLNVLNNITVAKEVTLDETNKDNTVKALSGLLPIIEVKASQDLTNSIFNFATTTLQSDILTIADGTVSEEILTGYTTNIIEYIADDQNIDSDEITPDITAVADSAETEEDVSVTINVIANDSFITTAPISVATTNGSNGTTILAESTPELVVYTPNQHFNGSDLFSYTITQGDKSSTTNVAITIGPINDPPSIDIPSTIQTPENQIDVAIIDVSDVDGDDVTLSLGGVDFEYFELSEDRVLTFSSAKVPDFETKNSYNISFTATDGELTDFKEVTILITNVNDVAPVISSSATFSAPENQIGIGTVIASDEEGDDLTYSVSGSNISISNKGVLTFIAAPDYESQTTYSGTVTVSDGELSDSQNISISVLNVNDNSPIIESTTFSVDESCSVRDSTNCSNGSTYIGQISASDIDGDSLSFSTLSSDFTITNSGILNFISPPDFETKQTHSVIISAFDGLFTIDKEIEVNINDLNDETPILGSTSYNFTSGILENQLSVGRVTATDADADSQLTFSLGGDDGDMFNVESQLIDGVWTGIITFKENPDYETKYQFNTILSVSDGLQSSDQSQQIWVDNVLEDIISSSFEISSGTFTQAPVLTATLVLDSASNATQVYAQLRSVAFATEIYCGGYTKSFPMTRTSNNSSGAIWTLEETLNEEANSQCRYDLSYGLNLYDISTETAPPTEGKHLHSYNNLLNVNDLQASIFHFPTIANDGSNTQALVNFRSRDSKNITIDGRFIFLYLPEQVYPEVCDTYQYFNGDQDDFGRTIEETTPVIAGFTGSCFEAIAPNYTDSENVEFEFYFYSLSSMFAADTYIWGPRKGDSVIADANGGTGSRELQWKMATIDSTDNRIGYVKHTFGREFLSTSSELVFVNVVPLLNSYSGFQPSVVPFNLHEGGADADMTAPSIQNIKIEPYQSSNDPLRDYMKFTVDFENTNAQTSVRDIWLETYGPNCQSHTVYVRDDKDGEIPLSSTQAVATIPYLTNQRGTYIIRSININDWGFAENYYAPSNAFSQNSSNGYIEGSPHPAIDTTFTVGDGSSDTCPYFPGYGTDTNIISPDEEQLNIGTFTAVSGSNDSITYSISGGDNDLINAVELNSSTGELKFLEAPDADTAGGDISSMSKGTISILAESNNSEFSRALSLEIILKNLNDNPPTIVSESISGDENQTAIGCISVTDPDFGPISAATPVASGSDEELSTACSNPTGTIDNVYREAATYTYSVSGDNLAINDSGRLTFLEAPDYETTSSYNATVTVSDGVYTTTKDIVVNVNDLNDNSPSITSDTTFTVDENQTGVGSITVSDPDSNSSFTYSIDADYKDGILFNIDSSGVITFIANPDYETKSVYKIRVNISDGAYTLTQVFTIILNDVCDHEIVFDGSNYSSLANNGTLEIREDYDGQIYYGRDDMKENSLYLAGLSFNSDDYDVCAAPVFNETFDISLTGPDSDLFELTASQANDFDTYNLYFKEKKLDYENPIDTDQNNVYEFTINSKLGGVTETKDISVTIKNLPEIGYIDSISLDEENNNFLLTFITNHDLPADTYSLRFAIGGPSYASSTNERLYTTAIYDSNQSTYNLVIDGISGLAAGESIIYGGYYEVYSIEVLNSSGSVLQRNSLSRVSGNRVFYYERSDGLNYPKITSVSGDLGFNSASNRTAGTGTVTTSNSFVDFRDEFESQDLYLGLRLDFDSGFNGRGDEVWHQGDYAVIEPVSSGNATYNLDLSLSPYLRSGDHRFRVFMAYYNSSGGAVYHYIYWQDLENLGLVDDDSQIVFRNPANFLEDVKGPVIQEYLLESTPTIDSCVLNTSTNEYTFDIETSLSFTDESIYTVSNSLWSNGEMGYARIDTAGNFIETIVLSNYDGYGATDRLNFTVSKEDHKIDAGSIGSTTEYFLIPYYIRLWDAAGISKLYVDHDIVSDFGRLYREDIKDLGYTEVDIREYCTATSSESNDALSGSIENNILDSNTSEITEFMIKNLERNNLSLGL